MSSTTPGLLVIGFSLAMAASVAPSAVRATEGSARPASQLREKALPAPVESAELKDLDRRLDLAVNGPGSAAGSAPATTLTKKPQAYVPDRKAQPWTHSVARIALGGFAVAAIAAAALSLLFISKLRPLSMPLMFLHAFLAVGGFILLLVSLYAQALGIPAGVRARACGDLTTEAVPASPARHPI